MKKELLLIGTVCAGLTFSGCSSAPGTASQQGAVVGGATGAAVGAGVAKNNRALGAIIGGAAGAAGGYVIGKKTGHIDDKDNNNTSSTTTAPGGAVVTGETADLNHDGFVTLDEIVKLDKEGVSDDEMIRRIQATGLTFDLNDEQRKYLSDHGVSSSVIERLPTVNRTYSTTVSPSGTAVISK